MSRIRQRGFFLASVAAIGFGLAQAADAQVTVTIAFGVDPQVLDPAHDTLITSVSTMLNIFDTLIHREGDGLLVPGLATSWHFPEPTVIELELRQGVTFHDGSPFTAEDVRFSLERYVDAANPVPFRPQIAGIVERVEVVSPHVVRIHLPTPQATILTNLARYHITSKAAYERMGDEGFAHSPVGTGPFRFVSWDRNQQIVLEANPDHWRGAPGFDRLVVRPIPEDFVRFAALKAGEVDIIVNVAPERVAEIEADPLLAVGAVRSVRNVFVGMNTFEPPFDDVRVRHALNHAVDKDALIDAVLLGRAYENPSVCSGAIVGHDPELESFEYDPDKARELLAEAGHPDGFETVMWGPVGRYLKDKEVQEAIAGMLLDVGVRVTHHMPEWSEFIGHFLQGTIPTMYFIGTGNPILDCEATMGYRIDSRRGGKFYSTPELDALIDAQIQELDTDKRDAIFKEIQATIRADAAWIFLYDQEDLYGLSARIDWQPRPDELIWAYDIKLVE